MSVLKPGWAEKMGQAQAGDDEAESRMRRKGQKPFSPPHQVEVSRARGNASSPRTDIKKRLDRCLGPVTED